MRKISVASVQSLLADKLESSDIVSVLDNIIHFLRQGGLQHASMRFDILLEALGEDEKLCALFGSRFHYWLAKSHIYPALVGLGIFSRSGFSREVGIRIYERFNPSCKDFHNLRDVFLYLFRSRHDEKWLQTINLRQWLNLYTLLCKHAEADSLQAASRQITQSRLHALEMLSIWVAAEELEPDFIRIEPKLLDVDSAFVALQREAAKLVEHYQSSSEPYDDAHMRVMLEQCRDIVSRLRRKGAGVGAGSSVKVAHLLERLSQTLDRITLLLNIQNSQDHSLRQRLTINLLNSMTMAAVEQHSTGLLWKRSVKMLAKSISENTSGHGEHYITHNRSEYWGMLRSAAGGGVLIALMALNKMHIGHLDWGPFMTAFLGGLNYGLGFMLIHMLHFTVATKQPAMTAASFAQEVERSDSGRAVDKKLAGLLVDVGRSQSVAVFGNVSVAVLLAGAIAAGYAYWHQQPLLDAEAVAYQLQSVKLFTQPTLWYAAIAGVWLFCSGIIAGFFDNRANYLDLRRRLNAHPLLVKIMPAGARSRLAAYLHRNYGSLAGNFIFGMLLGMTGYFGHLLNLPLDIRHVAFSSANIGYAAVSGHIGFFSFLINLASVLMIGLVNLWVSFTLALLVALRARDTRIDSFPKLLHSVWLQIKANPLNLIFPVQAATEIIRENKKDIKSG